MSRDKSLASIIQIIILSLFVGTCILILVYLGFINRECISCGYSDYNFIFPHWYCVGVRDGNTVVVPLSKVRKE